MTTKTITGTIYICVPYPGADPVFSTHEMSEHGWCVLGSHQLTLDVPEVDERGQFVAALRQQAERMKADHHVALGDIENQIQSLLAIEHDA